MAINRYRDMLSVVPKGQFYSSNGQLIPYRNSPYSFFFRTGKPSTTYRVTVNGRDNGNVVSDAKGDVEFGAPHKNNIVLDLGENEIILYEELSTNKVVGYMTTRHSATLMASVAQAMEGSYVSDGTLVEPGVDSDVQVVKEGSILETADSDFAENVFGKMVGTPNLSAYNLVNYRGLLRELRAAYRYYGGTHDGISRGVRAYTQVSPLVFDFGFARSWKLGRDFIDATGKYAYGSIEPSPGVTGEIPTVVDTNLYVGSHALSYDSASNKFALTNVYTGATGVPVSVPSGTNVSLTVYDGKYSVPTVGAAGPYKITQNVNDRLTIDLGIGNGPKVITLTPGAARTAANLASDINSALSGSYAYSGTSSGEPSGTHLCILNINGDTKLLWSGDKDCLQTVFDIPNVRAKVAQTSMVGDTFITVDGPLALWPSASEDSPINAYVGVGTYAGASDAPTVLVPDAHPEAVKIVSVEDIGGGQHKLHLKSALLYAHTAGVKVEAVGQVPFVNRPIGGDRYVTMTIADPSQLVSPWNDTFGQIIVSGSSMPDGWVVQHTDGTIISAEQPKVKQFEDDDAYLLTGDTQVTIPVADGILKYKGYDAKVSVWGAPIDSSLAVTAIEMSFDGGDTYVSTTLNVTNATSLQTLSGSRYDSTFRIPPPASSVLLKITVDGSQSDKFRLDRVDLTVNNVWGLFTGSGTIPRSDSRIKQGQNVFVWCPEKLTSQEKAQIGINSTNGTAGHISTLAPANSWVEMYDVTEYDGDEPKNVVGVYNYVHFDSSGESNNLALNGDSISNVGRFAFMEPLVESEASATLEWTENPPYRASLFYKGDVDAGGVLYEGNVPLTSDEWSFVDESTIEKTTAPELNTSYTIEYNRLTRYTTDVLDLGTSYQDYMWFADAHVWLRPEIIPSDIELEVQLRFDTNGDAKLQVPSNGNKFVCTITEDTGTSTRVVPVSSWSFRSIDTVNMSLGEISRNALYTIKYTARIVISDTQAKFKLEIRSAATLNDVSSAEWSEIQVNGLVDTSANQYHQMRVTLNNIRDTSDVRIQSVLLKGLNMYGSGGTVPVLRPS